MVAHRQFGVVVAVVVVVGAAVVFVGAAGVAVVVVETVGQLSFGKEQVED